MSEEDAPAATTLVVTRVPAPAPADDPQAAAWDDTPELVVPLLAQQLVPPRLATLGVADLRVRALHDGSRLAFRLEWEDESVEDLDGIGAYHDAVAVMVPRTRGAKPPPITMGAPGEPVDIFQWRATWQRDVDSNGKTGVDQIYPRVVHDVMPDDVLPPETAALYWVGRAAGNPLSLSTRTTPVERIVAEGFGSTTHVTTRGHPRPWAPRRLVVARRARLPGASTATAAPPARGGLRGVAGQPGQPRWPQALRRLGPGPARGAS